MPSAGCTCADTHFCYQRVGRGGGGRKTAVIMVKLLGATVCPDLCTPGLVDGCASTRIHSIVSKKTAAILGNPTDHGCLPVVFCVLNLIQKLMRGMCNCHKTTLYLIT